MPHMIKNKLRGLMAAVVAVVAALALVPGTAFADTLAGTGKLTVGPFEEDVRVDIYRVVEYNQVGAGTADAKPVYEWKLAQGLDIQGYDGLTADSDQMKAAAGKMATWARQQEKPTDSKTVTAGGSAEFTDLEPGQYLILVTATGEDSSAIYQNMVADLKPAQDDDGVWSIEDVAVSNIKSSDKPKIDKNITGATDDADETDDYKVGDWVPYTITADIPVYPNDQWDDTVFKITDTMTKGLTAPESTDATHYYKITIDGSDASFYLKSAITSTPAADGSTATVFEFDYAKLAGASLIGKKVTITYSAQINDAVKVIGGATESNEAKLDFGQNDESTTDTVKVDTYAISIVKTDADASSQFLKAVFGVYSDSGCTAEVGQITTNETDGTGFLAGLKAGTYYVKEITAPDGYQLDTTVYTVTVPDGGNDNNVNLDITNKKEIPVLPTTGGAGTIGLTAAGVVLIAGAAAFIAHSRKEN